MIKNRNYEQENKSALPCFSFIVLTRKNVAKGAVCISDDGMRGD